MALSVASVLQGRRLFQGLPLPDSEMPQNNLKPMCGGLGSQLGVMLSEVESLVC